MVAPGSIEPSAHEADPERTEIGQAHHGRERGACRLRRTGPRHHVKLHQVPGHVGEADDHAYHGRRALSDQPQ